MVDRSLALGCLDSGIQNNVGICCDTKLLQVHVGEIQDLVQREFGCKRRAITQLTDPLVRLLEMALEGGLVLLLSSRGNSSSS